MALPDEIPPGKQTNIVANKARHLIFFEGEDLCYNYKTDQWSLVSAYDTYGLFSVNSKTADIGLVVFSAGSVHLQTQATTDDAQTATFETGAIDMNTGGRTVVTGVRPLINGGTTTVRVGAQDNPGGTVTYSTSTSLNSRTQMANIRREGRYVRAEITIAGGFTTFLGADVEFSPQGRV